MNVKDLKNMITGLTDDATVHIVVHVPYEMQDSRILNFRTEHNTIVIECEPLCYEEEECEEEDLPEVE